MTVDYDRPKRQTYLALFCRLLAAARSLPPSKAALVGMHFERWAARRKRFLGDPSAEAACTTCPTELAGSAPRRCMCTSA